MIRTFLAAIGLIALVTLGGVVYAGYEVYQTTAHAMAAVSSFKGKLPHIPKQPGTHQPAGFSGFPTPPTTSRHGKHHRYPQRPQMPVLPPGRPPLP